MGRYRLPRRPFREFSKLDALKELPVSVVTGDSDRLVPVSGVRRWVDEMKSRKIDVSYTEIKGGRHFLTIIRNPKMIAGVFDLFDKWKREAEMIGAPDTRSWRHSK